MAHALSGHPRGVSRHAPTRGTEYYEEDADQRLANREALQYSLFGGFNFSAAFFGWIVASGIGVLLTTALAAAGGAVAFSAVQSHGTTQVLNGINVGSVATAGVISAILLLIAFGVAYYAGGYVAGRMARFDGVAQGVGTWVISLVVMVVLGALGAAFGARYNILQAINLPHLPIREGSWTTAGIITAIAMLAVTLLASIAGGRAGVSYHRRIDEITAAEE